MYQQENPEQRCEGKPGDAGLSVAQNDERREQRADGGTGVATHLKQRLRQSVPATRGHARDA
jgi:hypothetical protein